MSYLIKDVVSANSNTEFRNDVQLSSYRSRHNFDLVKGYIFTRKAADGKQSSVDLLKHLCDSFTPGKNPNRFVFMATYGHGKSHFSLALANFFGKKASSPEASIVLSKIEHAVNDKAVYGHIESFKKNHNPFLILIMSGTDQRDLPTQFYSSIDLSLNEDGLSANYVLPFWYSGALEFLNKIPESLSNVVEKYLEKNGYELDLLKERVKSHDSTTFDVCHNLFLHLYSVPPSFGVVQGLKQSVEWLSQNLCGENKPYSGVLILFDEFSAFVRDYGLTMGTRPGTPLQDLLDGVENCRERVTFVALSQHDPETVAETTLKRASTEDLQNLKIQLNRLPMAQRYQFHSSLEEVLDAYLKQDTTVWKNIINDTNFSCNLFESNDIAYDTFSRRYKDVLDWDSEHFQEIVTKGCYPLHPMTTAILCTVDLQESANPRSVLGYVLKYIDKISGEPVVKDGIPSLILPITLVDYFTEMLGRDVWNDYLDAKVQAGGPDAELGEVCSLKAMVLQTTAQVPTKQFGYSKIIGQFSGLSGNEADRALQGLSDSGVIRHDPIKKLHMFWPAGKGANKVEEILSKKLKSIKSLDLNLLNKLEVDLKKTNLLNPLPIAVQWGHREDWKAENFLSSKELFTRDWLVKLANSELLERLDGADKCRGLIVWLLADSDECVEWFRKNTSIILRESFGDQTLPLIVKRPRNPNPDFINLIKRSYGLSQFNSMDISDAGKEQFETVQSLNLTGLKQSSSVFFSDAETEVLPAFNARIKAAMPPNTEYIFRELFSMAYPSGPQRWFTQYKVSQASLKSATKVLVGLLLENSLNSAQALTNSPVAKEAVDLFLKPDWKIVGSDLRLCRPGTGSKVFPAWEYLDNEFDKKNGSVYLKKIFKKLLVSPFGYDITTAMILFSAWLGYNKQDVVISKCGKVVSSNYFSSEIKTFIKEISDFTLKMNDPNELKKEVNKILKEISVGGILKKDAMNYISTLNKYYERADADDPKSAESAASKLHSEYIKTKKYDDDVDEIFINISVLNVTTDNLLSALETSKKLKVSTVVLPKNEGLSETRKAIISKIRARVELECLKTEKINDISQYALKLSSLNALLDGLKKNDITDLIVIVEDAIKTLNKNREVIENISKDSEIIGYVNGLSIRGKLIDLNKNIEILDEFIVFSDKAESIIAEKKRIIRCGIDKLIFNAQKFSEIIPTINNTSELKEVETRILKAQTLFEGSCEISILDKALAECIDRNSILSRKELSKLESEEKDAPIVAVIDQFSTYSQSLKVLREHESLLLNYKFNSSVAQEKAKVKVDEIHKEINALEKFFKECIEQSSHIVNENGTMSLRTKLIEKIGLYHGTEEYSSLLNAREKYDNYLLFFSDISFVSHVKGESPDEIYGVIRKLGDIKTQYQSLIGAELVPIVCSIVEDYKGQIVSNEKKAIKWLDNLKNWSKENLSPRKVLSELENPPPFLPTGSLDDLHVLKSSIEKVLDSDHLLQIFELFKGISDRKTREKCINKLQEFIDDASIL